MRVTYPRNRAERLVGLFEFFTDRRTFTLYLDTLEIYGSVEALSGKQGKYNRRSFASSDGPGSGWEI